MSELNRPQPVRTAPGTAALLATGCGTAMASVCAVGLFQIERLLGGVWSVAAILCAGLVCLALARSLARLAEVVPSGAGLLAYLSRGLGRPAGMMLALPYLLLTLFLVGAEATIVGQLCALLSPLPAAAGSLLFLIGTWVLCRAGVRIGYGVQAIATGALVVGLGSLALYALYGAAERGELLVRLVPVVPEWDHFVAGVGLALFLFMGFELVTSQVELAATPQAVGRALRGSVIVLAAFYALLSLGFSCLPEGAVTADHVLVPQLAIAGQTGQPGAIALVAGLSLLASFTSFNGALLSLSRFTAALAAQGVLPRRLGQLDVRTRVPRAALAALLALAIGATALVRQGALQPSILAAAVAASVVYAGVAWVRERPPFVGPERACGWRWAGGALSIGLVTLGVGVLVDAGAALPGTFALLGAASAAALFVVLRGVRGRRAPSRLGGFSHPIREGVTHVP